MFINNEPETWKSKQTNKAKALIFLEMNRNDKVLKSQMNKIAKLSFLSK